ncbi:hypothetical protein TNCV_2821001 [Trichonephila clavipes]|nr:hypothetical protein TNCV_2821001 [Trichonephila clavipes]
MDDFSLLVVTSQNSVQALYLGGVTSKGLRSVFDTGPLKTSHVTVPNGLKLHLVMPKIHQNSKLPAEVTRYTTRGLKQMCIIYGPL